MSRHHGGGGWRVLFGLLPVLFAYVFITRSLGLGFAIPVGVLSIVGATVVLRGPLGRAWARRLEGDAGQPPDEMITELEDLRVRVLELEERVDFSERMLAQQRSESPAKGG